MRMTMAPAAAIALVIALGASACGGGDATVADDSAPGNEIDRAFVANMIPHHESAVAMAEIAQERGEDEFVTSLADDIVDTQTEEIAKMEEIDGQLEDAGVGAGDIGLPQDMAGMEEGTGSLETADPFDRAFVDMMVPHHQAAIVMARVELASGQNAELMQLAEAIIDAQSREIEAMNSFREEEYGDPSPAGGVPAEQEAGGGEHSTMPGM